MALRRVIVGIMLCACLQLNGYVGSWADGLDNQPGFLSVSAAVAEAGNDEAVEISFTNMYAESTGRGLQFSDEFKQLNGKQVVMNGYMAPPLKPSFLFFVLTRQPMAMCPFCSTDESWPEDIVLVYLPEAGQSVPADAILQVTGTLELGSYTDPDTGFVSQARIEASEIKRVR